MTFLFFYLFILVLGDLKDKVYDNISRKIEKLKMNIHNEFTKMKKNMNMQKLPKLIKMCRLVYIRAKSFLLVLCNSTTFPVKSLL